MLTEPTDQMRREALTRVISTILVFSPEETERILTATTEAAAAIPSINTQSVWDFFNSVASNGT